jgi:EAL domain-containing protein (putative c-di-GMP-specific phosphodiesterase class I)
MPVAPIEEVLADLSKTPRNFGSVQRVLVESLSASFGLSRTTIMLYNKATNMLESVSAVGVPNIDHRNIRAPVIRIPGISSRAVEARAFLENRPIVVRDRSADPQYRERHKYPHKTFSREFAAFPLAAGSRKLGIIAVAVDDGNPVRLTRRITDRLAALTPAIARVIRASVPQMQTDRTMIGVLNEVLGNRLLSTVYQPIVDIRKRSVHGYESLLRVRHSLMDGPAALFSYAERLNTLRDLSFFSHTAALKAVEKLAPGQRLFLNLHPKDFVEYEDLGHRANPFHGRDLSRLVFEITERCYLKNVDRIHTVIGHFKAAGASIALDDLGSGYSSLEVLTSLEPDYVKIDMSLIRNIHENDRKQKMMRALLYYCEQIGAGCVAEGVETEDEYQTLSGIGTRLMQGFFLSRPQEDLVSNAALRERFKIIHAGSIFKYRDAGVR